MVCICIRGAIKILIFAKINAGARSTVDFRKPCRSARPCRFLSICCFLDQGAQTEIFTLFLLIILYKRNKFMTNKDNKKNKKNERHDVNINSWKQQKNVNCFMLRGSCSNMV